MAINKEYNDIQLDVKFTQASTRANLVSEENISVSFGKISKYFADLHSQAFTGYSHPTHTAHSSGLYKITVDGLGHVSDTAAVTASDLPAHTHSDYVLKTGDTMSGNLTFAVADGSDTPGIVFKRGNFTDTSLDWKIYNSSGALMMDRTVAGDTETWQNKFKVDGTGIWYGGTQVSLVGHTHSQYLPKTTYEWNKEISFGNSGYLKIGSFPMYDTNITIDINATTSKTYHGTVVIATQNVSTTSMGSYHKIYVYDDPTGNIAASLRIVWTSGSRNYDIYFVPQSWSKNFIHIRALGNYMDGATDICVSQTGTVPTTTPGLEPVNILSVTSTGDGNAVTKVEIDSIGNLAVTKGSTFLTEHPTITKSADTTSTASPAHGGTFTVVDSVTREANGHVTKINTKTVTLPSDQNTDTLMTQTNTTGSADYRVLLSGNANDTTETTTGRKSTNLKFNPSTGVLSASSGVTTKTITRSALKGMLTGSGTAAQDKGSGVSPRYFPAKWTFNTGLTAVNGDVFIIKLPTAGHSYGVFLSIDNGANYYPISVNGTSKLTTHYGNGYSIAVMFKSDGSTADVFPLAGGNSRSTVTGGCWQVLNYYDSGNSNTYDRNRYNANIKAGSSPLVAGNIIVGKDGVFNHLKSGGAFDISYPILYLNAAVAASATTTDTYDILHITITTTQSITLTAYKPVFIKGTLSGTIFTPVSATPLTQTVPTTDDGYVYIYLGNATSTTTMYLQERHPIYTYKNGAFGEITNYSANAGSVAWDNVTGKPSTFTPASGSDYYIKNLTGSSRSTATTKSWVSMCNSTQTGSPTLPTSGKWWHVLSLDCWNGAPNNWVSQLALPTQDDSSIYYRKNPSSGTSIESGTWIKVLDALNVGYVMSSAIKYDPHARCFTSSKTNSAWNTQAYSNTGYADNVYISFRPGQTTMYAMIGLDANPSEDANYDKIDYCWYIQNNGALSVYESGTSVTITGHTTYASGDEFRVEYSCGEIRYYHNGTMCRSVARAVSGKLFFDSSFYNAGNVYDFSYGTSTHSTHTAEIITSTYKSSTYVTSLTSSAITLSDAESSFGGWICGPTKNGRIVISSYQGSNDKLYFGYGERGRTTNSYVKAMTWDGPTNTLTADKFVGALQGNADTATSATKATQDGDGNTISSTYLKLSGGTMTGDIEYAGDGNRKIALGKNSFKYYVASNAGWAGGLSYYSNDGSTGLGYFGAYGQANTLEYHFIGGTYNAPQIKIEPTGPNLIINSEDASTPMITFFRKGSNKADWRIVNTGGNLKFQSDYTTTVGDWYDALTVEYNTGNITMKTNATFTFGKFASASANANRHVFFKDDSANRICVNDNFKYNPSTNILTVGSITGSAATWTTGRTLTIGSTGKSVDGSGNVSWTLSEIGAAASSHTHGNITNGGALQTTDITIANGDKLVVTDSSNSNKVARTSISFDGSTTSKCLTQKGTWETPPDTKNTAGSTDTSSKIFLIGATSQAANPQTYSDNEVYTTSGVLTTKKIQVGGGSCTMEYNSTTQTLDFVFV